MSYDGHLGFGLLGDYDALPDIEEIALDLQAAIDSLGRAAGLRPRITRSANGRPARKPAKPRSSAARTSAKQS
jgi:hypothetical protein